ncbi:hypothetical protein NDU88_002286 [Pleurodeles waltl]|uniref:Uncharacterized protein n=1 Tax=Pleurodeles waltl TaxID=8319 RepID=A0AAV7Q9G1_PLEWA|nr:hypothetical protein NDU88_002286 [Pleurodeles waltl]
MGPVSASTLGSLTTTAQSPPAAPRDAPNVRNHQSPPEGGGGRQQHPSPGHATGRSKPHPRWGLAHSFESGLLLAATGPGGTDSASRPTPDPGARQTAGRSPWGLQHRISSLMRRQHQARRATPPIRDVPSPVPQITFCCCSSPAAARLFS